MSIEELSKQEVFVIEQLHVAREWVFAVKALRAHYNNNYELEAWYLLEAGQWNDSHTVNRRNNLHPVISDWLHQRCMKGFSCRLLYNNNN